MRRFYPPVHLPGTAFWRALLAFSAVAAFGTAPAATREVLAVDRDHERMVRTIFLSEANYKIVMTAKTVTACELTSDPLFRRREGAKAKYGEGKSIDVPAEVLADLREELGKPGAYLLPMGNRGSSSAFGCIPNYVVRLRFATESQALEVNFSYSCDDVALSRGNDFYHEANFRKESKFLDLCLRLFPDNESLKRFKSQRKE